MCIDDSQNLNMKFEENNNEEPTTWFFLNSKIKHEFVGNFLKVGQCVTWHSSRLTRVSEY